MGVSGQSQSETLGQVFGRVSDHYADQICLIQDEKELTPIVRLSKQREPTCQQYRQGYLRVGLSERDLRYMRNGVARGANRAANT